MDANNLSSSLAEIEVEKVPKPVISKQRKKKKKRFKSKNSKSKMKKDNHGPVNYNSEEYHKKQHTIK